MNNCRYVHFFLFFLRSNTERNTRFFLDWGCVAVRPFAADVGLDYLSDSGPGLWLSNRCRQRHVGRRIARDPRDVGPDFQRSVTRSSYPAPCARRCSARDLAAARARRLAVIHSDVKRLLHRRSPSAVYQSSLDTASESQPTARAVSDRESRESPQIHFARAPSERSVTSPAAPLVAVLPERECALPAHARRPPLTPASLGGKRACSRLRLLLRPVGAH